MLSRRLITKFGNLNKARVFNAARAFSADAGEQPAASVPEPTQEEIDQNRSEWGI